MGTLMIKNIGCLSTMRHPKRHSGPLAGAEMSQTEELVNQAIYIVDGLVTEIGSTDELVLKYSAAHEIIDAEGQLVTPGLVDPHTHLVHGGSRENELAKKMAGVPYLQILQDGGGILSTVRSTREASEDELYAKALKSLKTMGQLGVTTVEAKSGYGLNYETELKQLRVTQRLKETQPIHLVSTYLGAHAVPPEFKGKEDVFVDELIADLPKIRAEKLAEFCDVFCEQGVFSVEQSQRLLLAAKALGFGVKIHADEIVSLGGAELAADLDAVSADHLLAASDAGLARMAESGVVAVVLPGTSWNLGKAHARARDMIDNFDLPVAVATDYNPGSCPTENLQLVMQFACHMLKLSPREVLVAATRNAAHAIHRGDVAGMIDVGRPADLVIWDAKNIDYMVYHYGVNHAHTVMIDGQIYFQKGE